MECGHPAVRSGPGPTTISSISVTAGPTTVVMVPVPVAPTSSQGAPETFGNVNGAIMLAESLAAIVSTLLAPPMLFRISNQQKLHDWASVGPRTNTHNSCWV